LMLAVPDAQVIRRASLAALREAVRWDLLIIGGGATGLGLAVDAAARGFKVACLESHDFAEGTSSRATKLVHGGVRYLAQGNIGLVREALHERATLLANAPHLAQPLPFVMPAYRMWELPFYGAGLKAYDALAGHRSLGPTEWLNAARTREALPTVRRAGLQGAIRYWDAQFDDARLAVALARTAQREGATVLNHCAVRGLHRDAGHVVGVTAQDVETGESFTLSAGCVVNATGVWVDDIRAMDRAAGEALPRAMVAPSQGTHLVVDARFMPGSNALLVPKTSDGRVLFGVPWLGKVILGTTDTARDDVQREPAALGQDVEFILSEAARYLEQPPTRADVRSVWVGLRPLVRADSAEDTKTLSREHTIRVAASGLVTVTGGKWTTYRAMAEDVLTQCMARQLLPRRAQLATEQLRLVGAAPGKPLCSPPGPHLYGSEAGELAALPGANHWLWRDGAGGLSEAMVRFAARFEMARTVGDVLARRSRVLFLDAEQAQRLAEPVARLLAEELGQPVPQAQVQAFTALAQRYRDLR
jgi:glycerol-3-phosphate dehydrogenase